MISCNSCSFENNGSSEKCVNCGEFLLRYNSFCGMPELDGKSRGQVLQMRYVVEELIHQDETGATYSAEDVMDDGIVFLRALPTGLKLNDEQVENIKANILSQREEKVNEFCRARSFEVSSKLRYFVYSISNQHIPDDQKINFIKEDAIGRIKAVEFKTDVPPAPSPESENKIKVLEEEKENALALAKEHENELNLIKCECADLESQLENTRKARALSESEVISKQEIIESLQEKLKGFEERYTSEITGYKNSIKELIQVNRNAEKSISEKDSQLEQLKAKFKEIEQKFDTGHIEIQQKIENAIDSKDQAEKKYGYLKENFEQFCSEAEKKEKDLKSKVSELELILNELTKKVQSDHSKQSSNDEIIEKLKKQLIGEQEKYTAELNKIAWRNKVLTENLAGADEKIQLLLEERNLASNSTEHTGSAKLEKANWKIKALKDEVERLNALYEDKTQIELQPARKPANKFYQIALPLSLITGLACGIGATYYYLNYSRNNISVKNKPVANFVAKTENPESSISDAVKTKLGDNSKKLNDPEGLDRLPNGKETDTANESPETENNSTDALQTIDNLVNAAQAGDVDAIFELGLAYYEGYGVEKDYEKALELFLKSAEGGLPTAMYNAGMMYQQGAGADPNEIEAVKWYKKASDHGLPKAMNHLAQMYYYGQAVEQNRETAAKYYEKSALAGNANAMYNIACLYQTGDGVENDIEKAMKWWIRAARQGDADSMMRLGEMFEGKYSIKKDLDKARHWYQKAADTGIETAKQKLKQLEITNQ